MSVPIEDIHENPFQEPDELTTNNNPLSSGAQCPNIIGQYNDQFQLIPKAWFYGPGQYPTSLVYGSSSIQLSAAGDHIFTCTREFQVNSTGAQKYKVGGVLKLQINSTFDNARWYTHLQTYPSGAGRNMYADAFVQWSMQRIKDKIKPLPPGLEKKPLPPKQFDVAGKTQLGFIVEEVPAEIVNTVLDDTGKPEKGIDLMGLCALQQAKIDELEKRVAILENKR